MSTPTVAQVAMLIDKHMQTTDSSGYPACLQEDWETEETAWNDRAQRSHSQHVAAHVIAAWVAPDLAAEPPAEPQHLTDPWPKLYACATDGCPDQGREHSLGPLAVFPGLVGQRPDPVCLRCGLGMAFVHPGWGQP